MTGFRAYPNSTIKGGFTPNSYTRLVFPNFIGTNYANGFWTPAPGWVSIMGQVWLPWGATGNPANYVVKIIKNGNEDIFAGVGTPGSFPQSFVIPVAGADLAEAGDSYGAYLFVTNGGCWVDGNPAHTWWSAIQP